MTYHCDIAGAPYTLTQVPSSLDGPGWMVTAASALTDRFHRSYFVRVDTEGRPNRCQCPDHYHRGNFCKHMAGVAALVTGLELATWPSWAEIES